MRGTHQGQQSARTASTGRTHDCKRPLRRAQHDLLHTGGHPHMRRLVTVLALIFAAGATACGVAAQQVARVPHVGVLAPLSAKGGSVDAFLTGMRALGWIDGGNVSIEVRFANGDPASLSANAAAFGAEKVDVIVAFSGESARAARRATATIPIVMDTG